MEWICESSLILLRLFWLLSTAGKILIFYTNKRTPFQKHSNDSLIKNTTLNNFLKYITLYYKIFCSVCQEWFKLCFSFKSNHAKLDWPPTRLQNHTVSSNLSARPTNKRATDKKRRNEARKCSQWRQWNARPQSKSIHHPTKVTCLPPLRFHFQFPDATLLTKYWLKII